MANIQSAKKRIKIMKRNRLQNRFYKSSFKSSIKKFLNALEIYKISRSTENEKNIRKKLSAVYSIIDKGTKRCLYHSNNAARKKAKLSRYLKIYLQ